MKTVEGYCIVDTDKGVRALESLVNEKIKEGWEPIGGVLAVEWQKNKFENAWTHEQAVVKMKEYKG